MIYIYIVCIVYIYIYIYVYIYIYIYQGPLAHDPRGAASFVASARYRPLVAPHHCRSLDAAAGPDAYSI